MQIQFMYALTSDIWSSAMGTLLTAGENILFLFKKLYDPFLWIGFTSLMVAGTLRGDGLL